MLTITGSPLLDHENKPIPMAKLLATKPLRSELLTRPGPGNRKLTYLSGDSVTRTLNDIFGFDGWCLEVKETKRESCERDDKKRYQVSYTAIVRLTHRHTGAFKEDCGAGDSLDRSLGTAVSHALKASVTDAMKRAARHFGDKLGNSLYDTTFTLNKAPKSLKDALQTYEIERAKTKFGFEKDRVKEQSKDVIITKGAGTDSSSADSRVVHVATPAIKVMNAGPNGTSRVQQQYQTPHQQSNHHKISVTRMNPTSSIANTSPVPNSMKKQSVNVTSKNATSNTTNTNSTTTKNIYNNANNGTNGTNAYNANKASVYSSNKPNISAAVPTTTSSSATINQRNQNTGSTITTSPYNTTVPQKSDKSPGLSRFQQTPALKQQLNRQPNPSSLPGHQTLSNQNHQRLSTASSVSSSVPAPFANRPRPSNGSSNNVQRQYRSRASTGQIMNPLSDITTSDNQNLPCQNLNGKRMMESDGNKPKKMTPYNISNPYSNSKK